MKKLAILALLPLSACIRLGAEPPPSLLTLTPAQAIPVGTDQNSGAAKSILIAEPNVPQELAVNRVPVRATDTSIAYVKDAQWVEPPARLFARQCEPPPRPRDLRALVNLLRNPGPYAGLQRPRCGDITPNRS